MRKRVLVFCDFYLPGYKSGGGMWTVVNLVDRFCDRYDFFIVTRNYDSKADTTPYSTVKTGVWNIVGNAQVHYLSAADITTSVCADLVSEVGPDCVFLNSAFSTPVIKFLMALRREMTPKLPVILAPCGELSVGALSSKPLKKKIYLAYAKFRRLYENVLWKASSELEVDEIKSVFGDRIRIMVAPDLAPKTILPEFSHEQKPAKESGTVRFVFLSRVVPKKNIRYFLECLGGIEKGNIKVDIVGPLEDHQYWSECLAIIDRLPKNIVVNIAGAVSYPEGLDHLIAGHFFALPTLNENFGYVFIESLAAGTPLLISDQTMWGEIEERNCGWCIPLKDTEKWVSTIRRCIDMGAEEYARMSQSARYFAVKWLAETNLEDSTAAVLQSAVGQK